MTNLTNMTRRTTLKALDGSFVDIHTAADLVCIATFSGDGYAHVVQLDDKEADELLTILAEDSPSLSGMVAEAHEQGEELGEQEGWDRAIDRVAELADDALDNAAGAGDVEELRILRAFVESLLAKTANY